MMRLLLTWEFTETKNNKLYGDVKFDEVEKKASYITPVLGGVGPMTIAMLMSNCVSAMEMYFSLRGI